MNISFCKDPLWRDPNTTSIPLTWCFQHLLGLVPVAVYFLTLPILYIQAKLSVLPSLEDDWLTSMKSGLTVLIIADKTFLLIRMIWEKYIVVNMIPLIEYVMPALQIITFLSILSASKRCLNNGIGSSGPIFCAWFLFVAFGLPEFYTWVSLGLDPNTLGMLNSYEYIAYLIYFPLISLQLILHFFTLQHTNKYENLSPEPQASFLSRQFYCWFNGIVRQGKSSPLVTDDLFELEPELQGKFLANEWQSVWNNVVTEYNKKKEKAVFFETYQELHTVDANPKTPLLHSNRLMRYGSHNECLKPEKREEPAHPSIVRRLFQLFKWQLIGATVAKFLSDLLQYVNPVLLGAMITYIEVDAPISRGITLALMMFITAELRSILLNNYFAAMYRIGVKIQTILTLAVYEKTLKLSTAARKERTIGEITNLMAIDVDRFQNIAPQISQYWSSPFSITIALVILYQTVGLASLGGLAVLILLIPCNALVGVKTKKWQTAQMKLKDERLKLTNEVLSGIRVVKLYAWENSMIQRITELRIREVHLIRKAQLTRSIVDVANASSPFIVSAISFAIYTLSSADHILTPQIAFVSLSVFAQLRAPLFMIAELIGQTVQVIVSNKRLKSFLVAEEVNEEAVLRDNSLGFKNAIDIEDASFSWDKHAIRPTLNTLQLEIPRGQLICVIGEVGSGKSSLMSGLLNEMEKINGFVGLHGEIAYVPQQSWIQSLTIRENIVFNKPFEVDFYQEVIQACALDKDFEFLPDGDFTQIGEKGVNLSGGQKARVSLARALYHRSDILLMDDPLSAVDAHVGQTIFDKGLGPNSLSSKATRVLITHSQIPLEHSDLIVIMSNGEISTTGTYSQLLENAETSQLIRKLEADTSPVESTSTSSNAHEEETSSPPTTDAEIPKSVHSRKKSRVSSKKAESEKPIKRVLPLKLIADEHVETGRVSNAIYVYYLKKMGLLCFFGFTGFLALNFTFSVVRSFWLSNWSDNVQNDPMSLGVRLGVFAGLGTCEMLFLYTSNVFLIFATVNSAIRLHAPLLYSVLRAPITFFDITPLGRILNRFSKDIEIVDLRLSSTFRFLFICSMSVFSTIVVISISTPAFVFVIIPLLIIYVLIIAYYIPTSRQLQRLASITRSPLFSMFSEVIQGVSSIRAYNVVNQFYDDFCDKLDLHIKCKYSSLVSSRWLSMRLEILGNIVILSAALLGVVAKQYNLITAGVIGMSLSYSLNMTNMLNFLLKSLSDVETNIVSVERISEFSNINQEDDLDKNTDGEMLPRNWPAYGSILIKDLYVKYRPDLDYALMDINAEIRPGEKIGVCGRTGSGKTTLASTLFRLIEPSSGQLFIDNINIGRLGLHRIREALTIIPQDPLLFSGSIRFNLDPFHKNSDSDLWQALADSNLKIFVQSLPNGLSHEISEGGQNISLGQRQLLCLARAILRKSKIIVIDEGTANVDLNTDRLIQVTIREKFAEATVITIAHRIDTIMDYNRIMVLDHARLVEFDTPANLLKKSDSLFYSFVNGNK